LSEGLSDPFDNPAMWESQIANQLGGTMTAKRCAWDVDVSIWGKDCRAEVKFSRAYPALFSEMRGHDCSRNVFKWAGLRRGRADAFILIGLDVDDAVCSFLIPDASIIGPAKSLTITAPSSAKSEARMEWASVPFSAILPAFARACHNAYDAPMRRAGTKSRARALNAAADLFQGGEHAG
jgi:hypothetical protein